MNGEELQQVIERERAAAAAVPHHVHVCEGTACLALQSDKIRDGIEREIGRRGMGRQCRVKPVGCPGLCAIGPLVKVETAAAAVPGADAAAQPEVVLYQQVKVEDAQAIATSIGQAPLQHLRADTSQPFFTRQLKIVLENCGEIDPERIEDYIARGGYLALSRVLHESTPTQVIDAVTRAGLRGRGGAGFPTGVKWATVAKSRGDKKYVICNGDEGDPGAFMDRSVMEGDPHRVLEGMIIAAFATGAQQGYLYVRAEYPMAVKRLRAAIRHAERSGFLGRNICGTSFSFDVDIRLGAGAFVCGEETALIASIEGGRGTPRPRPPFPAERGLWGAPTLINNVETMANIAPILRKGPEWFSAIGTEKSKGTKVFALTGQIRSSGLIEVPMGMTLREIVFDIGGGVAKGRRFKAVQTGGPSGGCIPEQFLDMPVDYESLAKVGSIMGSGGMIVMDDSTNMVEVARYFMEFCMDESCGKCVPCRVGTAHMHRLLSKFAAKAATKADLERLETLCDVVRNASLCGLGQSAPNPVISTLRYFRKEYEDALQAG